MTPLLILMLLWAFSLGFIFAVHLHHWAKKRGKLGADFLFVKEWWKLCLIPVLLVCVGCDFTAPVKAYSKKHKCSCKIDTINNCSGGHIENGKKIRHECDFNFKCSDGNTVTVRG